MSEYRKIGVWQTAFLGDAVLTLPLLHVLREQYPDSEIHFFVRAGVESIFMGQPEIDQVHPFDKRGKQKSLKDAYQFGKERGNEGFDLWISTHTSFRSALIAKATGIERRIGFEAPWFNRVLYTDTVPRNFEKFAEIERLHQLLGPLGIQSPVPHTQLVLPEAVRKEADVFWAEHLEGKPVLGLHPGSTWPTKCWPVASFSRIIDKAVMAGVNVLLFAGPDEMEIAQQVVDGISVPTETIWNLAGKLSLPQLAAFLGKLDVYLTNDSGPMHIAWMQDVPLVALFGPTVERLGFFPRGPHSTVAEVSLDCRPCGLHGARHCPLGHHNCMQQLTPEMIWEQLSKKLKLPV